MLTCEENSEMHNYYKPVYAMNSMTFLKFACSTNLRLEQIPIDSFFNLSSYNYNVKIIENRKAFPFTCFYLFIKHFYEFFCVIFHQQMEIFCLFWNQPAEFARAQIRYAWHALFSPNEPSSVVHVKVTAVKNQTNLTFFVCELCTKTWF